MRFKAKACFLTDQIDSTCAHALSGFVAGLPPRGIISDLFANTANHVINTAGATTAGSTRAIANATAGGVVWAGTSHVKIMAGESGMLHGRSKAIGFSPMGALM